MRPLVATLVGLAILCTATLAAAQALPAAVAEVAPNLKRLGAGKLTWFGLHVYDTSLWVTGERFTPNQTFALELTYRMNLKGRDIAERSVKEMRAQGLMDEAKLQRWLTEMEQAFPDIRAGDQLTGLSSASGGTPRETRFFHNGKPTRVVMDAEFTRAFFDIWLSEKTSEPDLRERLLGKGN